MEETKGEGSTFGLQKTKMNRIVGAIHTGLPSSNNVTRDDLISQDITSNNDEELEDNEQTFPVINRTTP